MSRHFPARERGSILIISLWALMLLSLLAIGVAWCTGLDLRLTQYQWQDASLIQMAKAVMPLALAGRAKSPSLYAGLNQPWSHQPEVFQSFDLPEGALMVAHTVTDENGVSQTLYGMEDELGRLNLNYASEEVLRRLFEGDETVVASLLDWRDADNERRPAGAERDTYMSRRVPYPCRNGPLGSVEELLLIQGMTPEIYQKVRDTVTVYGPGQINLNTAKPEVFRALGLSVGMTRKILDYRRGTDGQVGTADDGLFTTLGKAVDELSGIISLTPEESSEFQRLLQRERFTVRTDFLRARVTAKLKDSKALRHFTLVFSTTPGALSRAQAWRESL